MPRRAKSPAVKRGAAKPDSEPAPVIQTEKKGKFTRAQGASSGAESWLIAMGLIAGVVWYQR